MELLGLNRTSPIRTGMRIALIDASLRPLSASKRKGGTLGKKFRPSVELMKVFSYCRKEHIEEVRLLIYHEEMEDLGRYNIVVVAKGGRSSEVSDSVALLLEMNKGLITGSKSVSEALYDMHEGTDILVVGSGMEPHPRARLGMPIDSCPADVDAYGEMLYVRNKLDASGKAGKRVIDLAYGNILLEDGSTMDARRMAMYSGSLDLEVTDEDLSRIPDGLLAEFFRSAAAARMRVGFREPVDLRSIGPEALKALAGVRILGTVMVFASPTEDRLALMTLADSCGSKNLCIIGDDPRVIVKDDDHMDRLERIAVDMDAAESMGMLHSYRPSKYDLASRFGPLYRMMANWRSARVMYRTASLMEYLRWNEQKAKGRSPLACEAIPLYEEVAEARPGFGKAMESIADRHARRRRDVRGDDDPADVQDNPVR